MLDFLIFYRDLLDELVDSGNMILVQYAFILLAIVSLILSKKVILIPFLALATVLIAIAAFLWLYHGIVRRDSIY
jgi:hypothetical protein